MSHGDMHVNRKRIGRSYPNITSHRGVWGGLGAHLLNIMNVYFGGASLWGGYPPTSIYVIYRGEYPNSSIQNLDNADSDA